MITGTQAADNLSGTAGDDAIEGLGGNDTLHGGGGNDTAVFAGNAAGYTMGLVGGALLVTDVDSSDGNTGTDRLDGFEWLQFGDRRFAVMPDLQVPRGEIPVSDSAAYGANGQVASLSDGGYVVVWQSYREGSVYDIYLQRYGSDGAAQGPELRANSTVANGQTQPSVAGAVDGGFVVTWQSSGQDGGGEGIYAQVFDAAGSPSGQEIQVNSTTALNQTAPSVAALQGGGSVVVWQTRDGNNDNYDQNGEGNDIVAQRFDASGVAVGGEIVLSALAGVQDPHPVVASQADGGYVVAWRFSRWYVDDFIQSGVRLQRFNADGTAEGTEIQVSAMMKGAGRLPAIAELSGGDIVVCWESRDGEVLARVLDADGAQLGPEIRVSSTSEGIQSAPAVTALDGGGYVVVWQSAGQDGSGTGVIARDFDATGTAMGPEVQVNTTTYLDQARPFVTALENGGYVVGWDGSGSSSGVYTQRFDADGKAEGVEITGSSLADVLQGGVGVQTLVGEGGDDTLDGGLGADSLEGGSGSDLYIVDDAADRVVESIVGGTDIDTVRSGVDFALGANFENLELTGAAVAGTGNSLSNRLNGNTLANALHGGAGDDTLSGGAGADTMVGGVGDDVYIVHNSADVIIELNSGGIDTVYSFVTRTLGDYENHLRLSGTSNIHGTGNAFDNKLTGNAASNRLDGVAGADSMQGGEGHDTLIGGTGDDTMRGGVGNDSYYVDSAADRVVEEAGAGVDAVYSSLASLALGAAIENGRILSTGAANMTGNALDNLIYAGRGNNVIAAGTGVDTLSYAYGANGTNGVTVGLADTASQATGGSGVDRISGFENITGSANGDRLTGNARRNVLDGGKGADTLAGGAGTDIYFVDDSGDLVVEAVGQGQDTVFSTLTSHALTDGVENGRILDRGAAGMTGNSLDNLIYAGVGDNVVVGGAGTDTLSYAYGIAGTRGVVVSLANGAQQDTGGSGTETISGFENLVGTGLRDTLLGNNLANVLTGGLGRDVLRGGAGNDTFDYNSAADSTVNANSQDVITDFARGDRLDLSTLDANVAVAGDQAFTLIIGSSSAFTAAGQLRLSNGVLYGNTDGDAVAEFGIALTGVTNLTAADFIL